MRSADSSAHPAAYRGDFKLPHTSFIVICPAADRPEIERIAGERQGTVKSGQPRGCAARHPLQSNAPLCDV